MLTDIQLVEVYEQETGFSVIMNLARQRLLGDSILTPWQPSFVEASMKTRFSSDTSKKMYNQDVEAEAKWCTGSLTKTTMGTHGTTEKVKGQTLKAKGERRLR